MTDKLPNPCLAGVDDLIGRLRLQGVGRLGVAYSGGADSTALLLAAVQRWPRQVEAFHVNHGMQLAAADFEQHCQQFCASRGIPLRVATLQIIPASGESPEEAARKARYAALVDLSRGFAIENVALAQHADDQVETLVLALTRGAGLPGLAGMASQFERDGVSFHRPLLTVAGHALRHWLVETGTAFVDDPSNANVTFTRNRIRHQVLPAMALAFPAFRQTLARSARHAAQAQVLLNQLAADDATRVGLPPHISNLQTLTPERQANLLRYWLVHMHQRAPSETQLLELIKQITACTTRGHRIHLKIANGLMQRKGDVLNWVDQGG